MIYFIMGYSFFVILLIVQGDFGEFFCAKSHHYLLSENVIYFSISFTVSEMHIQHIC